MAYQFNRNFNSGRGYNNYNQQRSFGSRYNNNGQRPKKHSGCKSGSIGKGKYQGSTYFAGWNYSKSAGLVSYFAAPYKKSKVTRSKQSGKEHVPYILKVYVARTKQTMVYPCNYNKTDQRITCDSLGLTMSAKSNYCGTYVRRKN